MCRARAFTKAFIQASKELVFFLLDVLSKIGERFYSGQNAKKTVSFSLLIGRWTGPRHVSFFMFAPFLHPFFLVVNAK